MLGGFVTPAGCTRLNLELSIFYALATASIFSTLSVIFSFLTVFLLHTAMMASFNRGQLPARQIKLKVWMTIVESGWNVWVWLVGVVIRRWV